MIDMRLVLLSTVLVAASCTNLDPAPPATAGLLGVPLPIVDPLLGVPVPPIPTPDPLLQQLLASPDPLQAAPDSTTMALRRVCFTVNNPGDLVPSTITGTLFSRGRFDAGRRVVVMLHGAVSDQTFMDGMGDPRWSLARNAAATGYSVITLDRLGFGLSPYNRLSSGRLLNFNSYVETTHQVIAQLQSGSYTLTTGACPSGAAPGFGSSKVVLLGHSMGGGITMNYAGRYHDIEAAIPIAWTNQGIPSTVQNFFVNTVVPTCALNDWTPFFRPGPDGMSTDCVQGTVYDPGMEPATKQAFCSNSAILKSPCGELLGALPMQAANMAVINLVGPTKVLLVWGDKDNFVTHANYAGPNGTDPDLVTAETAYWRSNCNCDVSELWQTDTGHAEPLHRSVAALATGIAGWLGSRGLSPR